MVHCTNRQKHSKPLVYQSSQVYQDCTNSVSMSKTVKNSQKTVKAAKMTIGVLIVTLLVHCWYSLGRHVTIATPMVICAVLVHEP